MSDILSYLPMALVFAALVGQTFLIWKNDKGVKRQFGGLRQHLDDQSNKADPVVDSLKEEMRGVWQRVNELESKLERLNVEVSGRLESIDSELRNLQRRPAKVTAVPNKPVPAKVLSDLMPVPRSTAESLPELVREFNDYAGSGDPDSLKSLKTKYELIPVTLDKFGNLEPAEGEVTIVSVRFGDCAALVPAPSIVQQFKDKKHRMTQSGTDLENCYHLLTDGSGYLKIVELALAEEQADGHWKFSNLKGILHGFV